MSQLTTRDYKGTAPRPRSAGGLSQFLWGTLAGALLAGLGAALILHHADNAARACTASGAAVTPAAGSANRATAPVMPTPADPESATSSGGNTRSSSSIWRAPDPGPQTGRSARVVSAAPAAQDTLARSGRNGSNVVAQRAPAPQPQYDFYEMLPNLKVTVPPPSAPGARRVGPRGRTQFAGYVLQAGAYRSFARARKLVSYLNFLGTLAHIDTVHNGATTLYEVRVGPVIERWEINRFRHQLRLIGLHPMLIPGATH
jgi:cell division septation protein DedD